MWEQMSPNIRSAQYTVIKDIYGDQMASLLRFKTNTLLNLDGATGAVIGDSYNAKRYNKIKKTHADKINKVLATYFGDCKLILEPYSLDNNEAKIKNAVLAVSNGVTTQLPAIKKLNPHWSDEECMREYLTTELKQQRPLTLPEVEEALKLGLIDDTYSTPLQTKQETLEDPMNASQDDGNNDPTAPQGEKQMENADKVNMQGVALPSEENK
jgi:hypothetical protein